jgi:hypothetical protein
MGDGQDGAVIISWGPIPISNICFPLGTPVKTDQGIIPIEQIHPINNTINKQAIKYITSTRSLDSYLICFEPNSISMNCPSQRTIMTKEHKILFKDRLVPAYRFLEHSDKVKKVAYSGDVLYNILLDEHSTISVNNIICETLHPENIIAKLYNSNISHTYKNEVITIMNEALKNKDVDTYKSIINHAF